MFSSYKKKIYGIRDISFSTPHTFIFNLQKLTSTHDLWFNPLTMYHPLVWHDWTFDFIVFLQKIGKYITYYHSGFELMNQFYLFWYTN